MKRILLLIPLALLGAFFFVYGEIDDSPGGQLIGVLMFGTSIFFLFRRK